MLHDTPHTSKQTWLWSIEEEDEQISRRRKQNANLKFMNSKSMLEPYHNCCQLHFNSHLKHEPQPLVFNQYHLEHKLLESMHPKHEKI